MLGGGQSSGPVKTNTARQNCIDLQLMTFFVMKYAVALRCLSGISNTDFIDLHNSMLSASFDHLFNIQEDYISVFQLIALN